MRIKKKQALQVLKKLKFKIRQGGKEAIVAQFFYEGQFIGFTRLPKGKGDLTVIGKFRKQIRLNNDQLRDAIQCPFKHNDYVLHLKNIQAISV
ncbi:MAG: hypothetical protein GY853_14295 [PVC group bacterium]|nr:hypothetical protein [PVC group bacterium]